MMKTIILSLLCCVLNTSYGQLERLESFGANPGNLNAFVYVPRSIDSLKNYSLVVALHGCSQTASEIAEETGWNKLAEKHGFIVLFPEQKVANNVSRCFNWFSKSDIRFNGESESIKNMIDYMLTSYPINPDAIYSYGLSAGGAMSSALLAQHPNLFSAGAVLAGGPFGVATNLSQAYKVMQGKKDSFETPEELASLVTKLHQEKQIYPKLVVLFGTADQVVDPKNSKELIMQWLGLLSTKIVKENKTTVGTENVARIAYMNDQNQELLIEYQIPNLGHYLPVDPGSEETQGGQIGQFSKAYGFFSTYYIAKDFGLIK